MKCKIYFMCLITIIFTFIITVPKLAYSSEDELSTKLNQEILSIIEHNQENYDSVKSLQSRLTVELKETFEDKGTLHAIQEEQIWSDSYHLRNDVLGSKYIGDSGPIVVNERGEGKQKGSVVALCKSAGTINIWSDESKLGYSPDNRTVTIVPSSMDNNLLLRENRLLKYQTLNGRPLKEVVLEIIDKCANFDTRADKVDGEDCILLEWSFENGIEVHVWVVPSKGYAIKKKQILVNDQVTDEYTTTLKEYSDGIWWINTVISSEGDYSEEISVDSLTLNNPLDPSIFTLAGTNIPHGTTIRDKILGYYYTYGQGTEIVGEDVDFALEAMKDSFEGNIEEKVNSEGGPTQVQLDSEKAPDELNEVESNQPLVGQSDSRNPLILPLVLGILAVIVAGVIIKVKVR